MNAYEAITNHQLVLAAFGQWPSFHDGEIHRLILDRTRRLPSGSFYPSVELFVRGWIMTSKITEAGYYRLDNNSLVHFLFEQVTELELDGLNHQNVLSSLELEMVQDQESGSPALAVELSHCYGLSGSFKAMQASVVSVVPYVSETAA